MGEKLLYLSAVTIDDAKVLSEYNVYPLIIVGKIHKYIGLESYSDLRTYPEYNIPFSSDVYVLNNFEQNNKFSGVILREGEKHSIKAREYHLDGYNFLLDDGSLIPIDNEIYLALQKLGINRRKSTIKQKN